MKLTDLTKEPDNPSARWKQKEYRLPGFDRSAVIAATHENPVWLHFGAGNIFRGFPAAALQTVLDTGLYSKGVIVAEGFDYDIISRVYRPYHNLSLLVILKTDGSLEKRVIGSITESLIADTANSDWKRLTDIFCDAGLQMVSFTITEKGYSLTGPDGSYFPQVQKEMAEGPLAPRGMMGKLASLCFSRFEAGAHPIALVSMDNCSHNGSRLHEGVSGIARAWKKNGFVPTGFIDWLDDPARVSFPWSMIDKITPRPDDSVRTILENEGFEDTEIIITEKNSWTAPFVNAEEAQYLVIEENFPNGRPPLEKGGLIFTDRETVDKIERMKVCTCLNPLHTALAIFGCLLSYDTISEEMKDPDLTRLIERLGYDEGLPVVTDPGIIRPRDFLKEVLEKRLPNPFLPDTPQRIACDTSQKLPIRFGQTMLAWQKQGKLTPDNLSATVLIIAGWFRYLLGIDDTGASYEPSPDPLLASLKDRMGNMQFGDSGPFDNILLPLLADSAIFGLDLSRTELAPAIISVFSEMNSAPGAVRSVLQNRL